ncbi:IgGFc-binding protein [bacterium]|nr:IgGFc-binding protein [bacterium]
MFKKAIFFVIILYFYTFSQAASIDSVWFREETDCNDSNIVTICYILSGDASDIDIRVSDDGGATWTVALTTLSGEDGDLGCGVAPGEHCFNWIMSEDLPGREGSDWVVEVSAFDLLDTFAIVDSTDISFSDRYGHGLGYGDGFYWVYDYTRGYVYQTSTLDEFTRDSIVDSFYIGSVNNCDISYCDSNIYFGRHGGEPDTLFRYDLRADSIEILFIAPDVSWNLQAVECNGSEVYASADIPGGEIQWVFEIDMSSLPSTRVDTILGLPRTDDCLAMDGDAFINGYLWSNNNNGKIVKVDIDLGEFVGCYEGNRPGTGTEGLCWDGEYLWSHDYARDYIYKIMIYDSIINVTSDMGPLDSRSPEITISCPAGPVVTGDVATFSWHVDDIFWVNDPCSISISYCGEIETYTIDDTFFEWTVPATECEDGYFIVAARDSFCNKTQGICMFEIENAYIPSSIDSLWFWEETDCDGINMVNICYLLTGDNADIFIDMSSDNGATWEVPLLNLFGAEGDTGESVAPGEHCFQWLMSTDLPDVENCGFQVRLSTDTGQFEYWLPYVINYTSCSSGTGSRIYVRGIYDSTQVEFDFDHDEVIDTTLYLDVYEAVAFSIPQIEMGTHIITDKPVEAYYTYHCSNHGLYEDGTLSYSLYPASMAGTDYAVPPADYTTILSIEDEAIVAIDTNYSGTLDLFFVLDKGEDTTFSSFTSPVHIYTENNKRIVVANAFHSGHHYSNTAAYNLLPTNLLGETYYAPMQHHYTLTVVSLHSRVEVIAVEPGTNININGTPYTPAVGELISFLTEDEVSVTADKPVVAVHISDVYATDPWSTHEDRHYMYAFCLFPKDELARRYVIPPVGELYSHGFPVRQYAIVSFTDGSSIDMDILDDGTIDTTFYLDAGEFVYLHEGDYPPFASSFASMESSSPFQVTYSHRGWWSSRSETCEGMIYNSKALPSAIIASGCLDSHPPEVETHCFAETVFAYDTVLFDWEISDMFEIDDPCSVFISYCGAAETFIMDESPFEWVVPNISCDSASFSVVARDSFCNWGEDLCYFNIAMGGTLHLALPDTVGLPGDTLRLPLMYSINQERSTSHFECAISFDPVIMSVNDLHTAGSIMDTWTSVDLDTGTEGLAVVSGSGSFTVEDTLLCFLEIVIPATAPEGGFTPLAFDSAGFSDMLLPIITDDGFLIVLFPPLEWLFDLVLDGDDYPLNTTLTIGLSYFGSEGYDPGLDIIHLPDPLSTPAWLILDDSLYPYITALQRDVRDVVGIPLCWSILTSKGSGWLTWNPELLPPGDFMLNGRVDMRSVDRYHYRTNETIVICFTRPRPVTYTYHFEVGWNMISFPVLPVYGDINHIFPSTEGDAYWYDPESRSYESTTLPERAKGFWVYSSGETETRIAGIMIEQYSLSVFEGWNMIGSVMDIVPFDGISFDPPASFIPPQYTFSSGGYVPSSEIVPALGYWCLSTGNSVIQVSP